MTWRLFIVLFVFWSGVSFGSSNGIHAVGYANPLPTPADVLRLKLEHLSQYMGKNPQADATVVYDFLREEIAPAIDFQQMGHWIAGPMNRMMSSEQRGRFVAGLRVYLLRNLASSLAGQRINDLYYFPERGNPAAGDVTVSVGLLGPGSIPVKLDFRLMRSQKGWRIVDVSANGISAVAYFRQQMAVMVRQYGVEGTLARLR